MPWQTPYGRGNFKELPLELKKFWLELMEYSLDDILENVVETIPIQFRDLQSIEKQFLFETVIDTLFGKEKREDQNAYLEIAADIPFTMFETYIDNDELPLSVLFSWIKMLILAWESLKINPDKTYIFDFYPLFRKPILLTILKNGDNLNEIDQIKIIDALEPYKEQIKEHLCSYIDDIKDSIFWSEDWLLELGWTARGYEKELFLKQYDIEPYYYDKFFKVEGNSLYIICPCHKTKKKFYYNQLHNKICKVEKEIEDIEKQEKRIHLLEKMAQQHASFVLQKKCHRWLWAPICKDGTNGINLRIGWDNINKLNNK